MKPFEYVRPESLDDLLALMSAHGPDARILAGGTDLLVRLRKGHDLPAVVIDLKRVKALRSDVVRTEESVRIGARTVIADVIAHADIRRWFPALVEAAGVVGSVQIRNRATLAGNLCNASPAADTAPALLAYAATINLIGSAGTRRIPVDEFFLGPGRTVLERGEILESIDLTIPPASTGAAFERLTRRQGVDLAIVSVCCLVHHSGHVVFGCGAMGPRPFAVRAVNEIAALEQLHESASPISDLRASRDYRAAMLMVIARRALNRARALA